MAQLKDLLVAGSARIVGESSFNDNVTINGDLSATNVSGNGSGLTNLNASNIASGTLAVGRLPTSGVTAGSYGLSSNKTGEHGKDFSIPYITVDTYGRITSISNKTLTLPTDNNTDTKVTQAAAITTNGNYPIILGYSTSTSSVTDTVNKASTLTYNPSTKVLTAGETLKIYSSSGGTTTLHFDRGSSAHWKVYNESAILKFDCDWDPVSNSKNSGGAFTNRFTINTAGDIAVTGIISTTGTTASTSKTTGALRVAGGAGIAGQMSANKVMVGDKTTLQYNSTYKALEFVF